MATTAGSRRSSPPEFSGALHIDLVFFGVMLVVNMMIGLVTPPFGMLLFVINALAGVPLKGMIHEAWLFIGVLIVALALMTVFPETVLWLPHQLGYGVK